MVVEIIETYLVDRRRIVGLLFEGREVQDEGQCKGERRRSRSNVQLLTTGTMVRALGA